jgi:hypothetical protein
MYDRDSINQQLRRVLNVTDEDLTANRRGQITTSQLFQVIKTAGPTLIATVGTASVLLTGVFLHLGLPILGQSMLVFVPLMVVLWLVLVRRSVKAVEGRLGKCEAISSDPREPQMSRITVQGMDFGVPDAVFNSFVEGLDYRVFYTAMGKWVVAAEHIDRQALPNP